MHIAGYSASQVSKRWGDRVVYAIFTSGIEKYHAALTSTLDTWGARPVNEGRFVAVGGNNYPEEWQVKDVVLKSICGDGMSSISCKEGQLVLEAASRGAAWVVITGEDNYVNTERIEEVLAERDPNKPVAYGIIGCGKELYCNDNEGMRTSGGFCGGCGYILSRGAVRTLVQDGVEKLRQIYDTIMPNDMATSCNLYKSGVPLEKMDNMFGFPIMDKAELDNFARERSFLTIHYLMPDTQRYMHLKMQRAPQARLADLEAKTFWGKRNCTYLPRGLPTRCF